MIKLAKYIFNSLLATNKNENEYTLSITLPNSYTVPSYGAKVWRTSIATTGKSASFRCYATSTKYNYAIQSYSFSIKARQDGYDGQLIADVFREGNNIVLEIVATGTFGQDTTYSDIGQTITVHVQTFTDPFV